MRTLIISHNLIFLEASWFNTVGFVLCQDKITREYRCYTDKLGGDRNEKYTEKQDIEEIMTHGSPFPLEAGKHLFQVDLTKDWVDETPELFL